MNTRKDWCINANSVSDVYYTKNETISDVIENFNIRRYSSSEGYSVTTLGVTPTTDQVIIQDHFNPINQNKTEKKIHISIDSVLNSGTQFIYKGENWMITSHLNIIDDAYKTGLITLCNYNLKFQNTLGDILSYPAIISLIGGTIDDENKFVVSSKTKFNIKLPFDDETIKLREDKRFMIDYEMTEPSCYKIVQRDVIGGKKGEYGVINLIVEACETNLSADNIPLMLCDYIEPKPVQDFDITYNNDAKIRIGGTKTFTSDTTDTVTWEVQSDIALITTISDNTIKIKCPFDDKLINNTFNLKATTDNGSSEINITITGGV